VRTEQEYDAQAEMIDDQDPSDQSAGPGPFPQPFQQPIQQQSMQPPMTSQSSGQSFLQPAIQQTESNNSLFTGLNQFVDPYDPSLDADPFGLSASMHFPTQFSFDSR